MARRKVPDSIRQTVLIEAGYRCGVPRCRNILALDLHHIVQVSEGGGNAPDNLLPLCGFCHDLYHRGEITRNAIRYWKGILVALNRAFDHQTIDDLLFLHKVHGSRQYLSRWLDLSADGVLKYSRLIGAGLATFTIVVYRDDGGENFYDYWAYAPDTSPSSYEISNGKYRVYLTDKGRMLVEAWISGDKAEVEKALTWV